MLVEIDGCICTCCTHSNDDPVLIIDLYVQGGEEVPVRQIEAVYEAVIEVILKILRSCHNL